MQKSQEEKILNRIDKFLFRCQCQVVGLLLPELKEILLERESLHREAQSKISNKDGV